MKVPYKIEGYDVVLNVFIDWHWERDINFDTIPKTRGARAPGNVLASFKRFFQETIGREKLGYIESISITPPGGREIEIRRGTLVRSLDGKRIGFVSHIEHWAKVFESRAEFFYVNLARDTQDMVAKMHFEVTYFVNDGGSTQTYRDLDDPACFSSLKEILTGFKIGR